MLHFWRVIGAARAREIASLNADRAQVEALEGEVRAQRALLDSMAQDEATQKTALVGERAWVDTGLDGRVLCGEPEAVEAHG